MSRPSLPVRHLVDPTPEQTEEAIHVMMDAFVGDSFMTTTLGRQETNPDIYYRFNRAHVLGALVDGELWVAEDGQKIVGIALWFLPGKGFLETEEQRERSGMDTVTADLGEDMQGWWKDYFPPRAEGLSDALMGPGEKLAAYYLLTLAVHPSYHNRGIGRTLMLTQAKRAWAEGKRVCWEAGNEPNVAKYEKWGGKALGDLRIDGLGGTGFTMWIMELPRPSGAA
ncbi:hypothetical protein CALVIDRAFT_535790 [Calocera viscosa TUFC12733]|uniref:N-acetyltransferase domain-containing protein n=1 Tax=Calocera viscosa (strain TUFC12733) TaxID=1330018 RepID=A0A167NGT9_CALVF|nr:hypothetical protein CALVIDRAFT_535790 [Calocera viscosa TUFC12733]